VSAELDQLSASKPAVGESNGLVRCWCCGQRRPAESVVHLGEHPEVAVCLNCAHFLHQRARSIEDAQRRSAAARARDGVRAVRQLVIARHWHEKPVIGPLLRWLGARLP
jgi:hypothetical protein